LVNILLFIQSERLVNTSENQQEDGENAERLAKRRE
jgi:hypothetical protein